MTGRVQSQQTGLDHPLQVFVESNRQGPFHVLQCNTYRAATLNWQANIGFEPTATSALLSRLG